MTRLLLAAAFAFAGAPAFAQTPPMRSLDLDRDGKVTLAEFRQSAQGLGVDRMDADKDGRLTRAEFEVLVRRAATFGGARARTRAESAWTSLDADRDGVVTGTERDAHQRRRFEAADTNHDGWLSKGELLMMRQNRARGD